MSYPNKKSQNNSDYVAPKHTKDIKSFFLACQNNDVDTVKKFVKKPNFDVNQADAEGIPAIIHAIISGDLEVVKCLIKNGADLTQTMQGGKTLLHVSAMGGDLALTQVLLEAKLDPNAKCDEGHTPLVDALVSGRYKSELISSLLIAGANPNVKLKNGMSPLLLAVKNQTLGVMVGLLRFGADINHRDARGENARDKIKQRLSQRSIPFYVNYGQWQQGMSHNTEVKNIEILLNKTHKRFDKIQDIVEDMESKKKTDFNVASMTLTQAAASHVFSEYISYRLKNKTPIALDEFMTADTSGVRPIDVLKHKKTFSQILRHDLWKDRKDELLKLYNKSFIGFEKIENKPAFQSFLIEQRLLDDAPTKKPTIRRRK